MKNITVLVDMDDVMEQFIEAWCKWLNDKHGTNVKETDITDWKMNSFFPTLSDYEIFEPTHLDDFWATVKPKKDAAKYMKLMINQGFDVYVCTASDYRTIKAKFEYIILKYFPFISWDKIIITNHKQKIKGDILIDDGIHNLLDGEYHKIMMSAPHNKKYDAQAHGIIRVENWKEAYDEVQKYAKKYMKE